MATHTKKGDALEGDKILGQARRMNGPDLLHMTGGHRGKKVELVRDAYCVIDVEFKFVREKKEEKKKKKEDPQ